MPNLGWYPLNRGYVVFLERATPLQVCQTKLDLSVHWNKHLLRSRWFGKVHSTQDIHNDARLSRRPPLPQDVEGAQGKQGRSVTPRGGGIRMKGGGHCSTDTGRQVTVLAKISTCRAQPLPHNSGRNEISLSVFCLFRAAPAAYGGSQLGGKSEM